MKTYINNLIVENARIIFRNFSGKPSEYNPAGKRTFTLVLNQEDAANMEKAGWNVKYLRPREPGDEPTPILKVNVNYDNSNPSRNPKVYNVIGRTKKLLDEETVGNMDYAEIVSCDLVISPYRWSMHGNEGVSAYLKEAYITTVDYFANKYDFDDSYDEEDLA